MNSTVGFRLLPAIVLSISTLDGAPVEDHVVRSFRRLELSSVFYCEGAAFGDIDRDGHTDIISGPYWYAGPSFEKKSEYYEAKPYNPKGYSDNFFAFVHDFDADGWQDIFIIGFPGKDASWFRNPQGKPGYWKRHIVFDGVDNESPHWTDLTGDGKPEIVCSTGGRFGYAEPDWSNPGAKWKFTPISENLRVGKFTHGLGVGDVNGDGRRDVLWKAGWFEQPTSLDGAGNWTFREFAFAPGRGGSQMYVYDVDGDGDNDVITGLDAHGFGLVWWEHIRKDGAVGFVEHPIMGSTREPDAESPHGPRFAGLHAIDLVDMDGDGLEDLVTGTRYWAHGGGDVGDNSSELYWFRLVRHKSGAVDFVPELMDDGSGVGTQVVVGDVNGDTLPDVVVGNKKGSFVLFHETRKVGEGKLRAARPQRVVTDGLAAAEAAKNMTLPRGFQVTVAASEPDILQPIQLAIDERGRVWVAEGHTYPNRAKGDEGADRILIFEDTDGDGTLDSRKVFIEGLNLVSGLEVGFGGVWVGAAPYLLFVPDANRDDKPDGPPKVLLDGWGYHDTHETLNSFTWGPDGWLYGCQGVFTHSRVGKPGAPDEERVPLNACVWRYHPTRHEFEVFAWGSSNPWGLDFNEHGHAFITACVIPHLYHVIQGGRYQRQAGPHFNPHVYDDIKTIADHLHHGGKLWKSDHNRLADKLGGGHAHCGAMIYLGDSFPEEYRGKIFMNNIHGNRVNVDVLERDGSGYVGRHGPDFLKANDLWFRGIDMKYGPDGSVWLIDWYDQQACHQRLQEVWDRTNGRIYRISFGTRKTPRLDLAGLDDRELVKLQLHSNEWHARASRRILQQRGGNANVHAALLEILESDREPTKLLRALWTLHVTNGLTEKIARRLLRSPKTHELLCSWTIQLVCERGQLSSELHNTLVNLASESGSPLVRLYIASALGRLPHSLRRKIAIGLAGHAEDADDKNLPLLLWYGVEPLVAENPSFADSLANRSRIPKLTRFITRRLASNVENLDPLMALLTRAGTDDQRRMLLEEATNAFRGHAKLPMPKGWQAAYESLSKSADPVVRDLSTAVAVKFGDRRVFPSLRRVATDSESTLEKRRTALSILLDGNDPDATGVLIRLLDEAPLRRDALRGLAAYDSDEIADAILSRFPKLSGDEKADAVNTLASRVSFARRLLAAVAEGSVARRDLSAFTVRQINGFGDAKLNEILAKSWGTIRATRKIKLAEIAAHKERLTKAAIAGSDLLNGRAVFARTCATCHALFGSGDTIAPDLTGSNRANLDYVLENVVDPSAVVGKDYQLNVVITKQGRLVSGLIRKRTSTAVTIRTVNEEVVVPTDDIVETRQETESMMPQGLFEKLSKDEIRDLIAYLRSPVQVPRRGTPVTFDRTTKRAPGAIEGETMKVLGRARGRTRPQTMGGYRRTRWSGNSQVWWTGAKPKDVLDLELPVDKTGRYQIDVCLTKAVDYGVVQFRIDGEVIDGPLDLFNDRVISTGPLTLGTRDLTKGKHRLSIEIVGANPKAKKAYMFGLDYVRMIPQE